MKYHTYTQELNLIIGPFDIFNRIFISSTKFNHRYRSANSNLSPTDVLQDEREKIPFNFLVKYSSQTQLSFDAGMPKVRSRVRKVKCQKIFTQWITSDLVWSVSHVNIEPITCHAIFAGPWFGQIHRTY